MVKEEKEIMGHKITFKTLTWGAKQAALREATKWTRGTGGALEPDIDPWTLNDLLLIGSIEDWDIQDESGQPVPLTLEGIRSLRPVLAEMLIAEMQAFNGITEEERKKS